MLTLCCHFYWPGWLTHWHGFSPYPWVIWALSPHAFLGPDCNTYPLTIKTGQGMPKSITQVPYCFLPLLCISSCPSPWWLWSVISAMMTTCLLVPWPEDPKGPGKPHSFKFSGMHTGNYFPVGNKDLYIQRAQEIQGMEAHIPQEGNKEWWFPNSWILSTEDIPPCNNHWIRACTASWIIRSEHGAPSCCLSCTFNKLSDPSVQQFLGGMLWDRSLGLVLMCPPPHFLCC